MRTSDKGGPKLIGVESWWNEGRPVGRSRGKRNKTPVISACNPKQVKVIHPRRPRSDHDESIETSNIVSPGKAVAAKDTESGLAEPLMKN
jgi:hypothetical protein